MERHNEAAVDAILQGMAWLGTPHDGPIVRQRERIGPLWRGANAPGPKEVRRWVRLQEG